MYSTARRFSSVSAIACAVNLMGLILYILTSPALNLPFSASFAIYTILIGAAACSLTLTLSMRSICQDLEYEYENNVSKIKEMSDRIKQLEADAKRK